MNPEYYEMPLEREEQEPLFDTLDEAEGLR